VEHAEIHHLRTDKGGRPHGHGDFLGALWPLEGAWVVEVIVGSIVRCDGYHLIQITVN